jgi:uncharacterized protein (DUF488 family)
MIEFTKSYKTADGQVFGSIEDAQIHEIEVLFEKNPFETPADAAKIVLKNKTILIDVLTTTPSSKPKARTTHGGTKNRNKKTIITDATTSITSSANVPDGVQTA